MLRTSFASYVLSFDANNGNSKKDVEDMFYPIFAALLDAILLRTQVYSSFEYTKFDVFSCLFCVLVV